MRYHHDDNNITTDMYGERYFCKEHPVYDFCTLYKIKKKGLAVIQQYYDPTEKTTKWGEVSKNLKDAIYLHPKFKEYFDERAGECDDDGVYPTVTVRQLMWALRMKPIKRERWETVFDRRDI